MLLYINTRILKFFHVLCFSFYALCSIGFLSNTVDPIDNKSIFFVCLVAFLLSLSFSTSQFLFFHRYNSRMLERVNQVLWLICILYFPIVYGIFLSQIRSLFESNELIYFECYMVSIGLIYFTFYTFIILYKDTLRSRGSNWSRFI